MTVATLKEKLNVQVENIVAIASSNSMNNETKARMLEVQRDYLAVEL